MKTLVDVFQTRRRHLIVVLILIAIQFLIPEICAVHYHFFRRPRQISAGAISCESHRSLLPKYVPNDCDLVTSTAVGNVTEEIYFSSDGSVEVLVTSESGRMIAAQGAFVRNQLFAVLPIVAIIALACATLRKMFRTGAWTTFELAKHPSTRNETTLLAYAIPVLISAIMAAWLRLGAG